MNNLEQYIKEIIASKEFQDKMADAIADLIQFELRKRLGGKRFYITSAGDKAEKVRRNAQIKQCFTGENYSELSKVFNLGKRQIHRILKHSDT